MNKQSSNQDQMRKQLARLINQYRLALQSGYRYKAQAIEAQMRKLTAELNRLRLFENKSHYEGN
jgi:hypothetical protein